MADDKHVYLVEFMKFNGTNFHEGVAIMKKMMKPFTEKIGATIIGAYLCAMGSPMELMIIFKYNTEGFDARVEHAKNMLSEEMLKMTKEHGSKFGTATYNFCKNISGKDVCPITPTSRVVMRQYTLKGMPFAGIQKFKESMEAGAKHMAATGLKMAGVFMLVFSETQNTVIALIEVPEGVSLHAMEEMGKGFMSDEVAKAKGKFIFEIYSSTDSKSK